MTSRVTIPLQPKIPTVLDGQAHVELPGYELWLNFIENVHVVPIRIHETTFARALSEALQAFPHAAGNLRRDNDQWNIILTDSPVILDIEFRADKTLGFQDACVVQGDLRPFLSQPSSRESLDSPLLRMKLTIAEYETAVGVSWHHTLGDATVLLCFMNFISQSPELVQSYLPLMPHLANSYPKSELHALYANMRKDIDRVDILIPEEKLCRLREKVSDRMHSSGSEPSIQDCLTAYIVTVLDRCLDAPITTVTDAASYRNVSPSLTGADVAGNAIYIIPTSLQPRDHQIANIAMTLRQSIQLAREPKFIEEWMSLTVNSNLSLDWRSAHFGCPGEVRFHTSGVNERYLRTFRSNGLRRRMLVVSTYALECQHISSTSNGASDTVGVAAYFEPVSREILACLGVLQMYA
ncbi:hypothetical protein A0H81_07143 [Grifola frondosa]|uniref:Uncharacterized protein n=1 Tax=Grifola frondosa TaxID=5627 RepID=A0A1C7M7W7_GRIFR|nr:hypothetical protein A0H81_07143 [Grifola frondosa]